MAVTAHATGGLACERTGSRHPEPERDPCGVTTSALPSPEAGYDVTELSPSRGLLGTFNFLIFTDFPDFSDFLGRLHPRQT